MVTIRSEEPQDIPAIARLHRTAFGGETEARIVEAVRAAPGFTRELSLVALRDGRVAGHILFSPIRIETASSPVPALALAPIAVLPEFRRQGIGSLLVEGGLRRCRDLGHAIVIVVGEGPFYTRFGFAPARARGLETPFPVPDEAFMVLELVPGALDGISDPAGSRDHPGGKGPLWSGISGMVCFPPFFLEGIPE